MPRHCSPENSVKEWAGFGGMTFGTFYPNSSRSCRSSRGIPNELDEAAELDGGRQLGIVLRIIRPRIRPALITTTLLSFSWTWEDFLTPAGLPERTHARHDLGGAPLVRGSLERPRRGGDLRQVGPVLGAGASRVRRLPAPPGHLRSEGLTGPWP